MAKGTWVISRGTVLISPVGDSSKYPHNFVGSLCGVLKLWAPPTKRTHNRVYDRSALR